MTVKIIHQIYISDNDCQPGSIIKKKITKIHDIYDNFDIRLYNNNQCYDAVNNAFGKKAAIVYSKIKPYAFKSDIARLAFLYLYGGYYYDIAIVPEKKFTFEDEDVVLYKRLPSDNTCNLPLIENSFMYFKNPKHPFLLNAIERILKSYIHKNIGIHPLDITGPMMLGRIDNSKYNISFGQIIHGMNCKESWYKNMLHYKHKEYGYHANLSSYGCVGTNNYEKMWFDGEIYA